MAFASASVEIKRKEEFKNGTESSSNI